MMTSTIMVSNMFMHTCLLSQCSLLILFLVYYSSVSVFKGIQKVPGAMMAAETSLINFVNREFNYQMYINL